jgi:hypothetical protein
MHCSHKGEAELAPAVLAALALHSKRDLKKEQLAAVLAAQYSQAMQLFVSAP